jgi:hypothetical protein
VTLAQMIVALADGAECVSDLAALRDQPALFGPVASQPTAWRTIGGLGPDEYRRLAGARATARAAAWAAGAGPAVDETIIDVDATIVRTRSDKEDAGPTHKRTWGHFPLLAMIAEIGEVLTGMFRAGNAGANKAEDHVVVLAAALAQLPADWQAGHQPGDDPTSVAHKLLARADSAGASHWFAEECRNRNIGYSLGYAIDHRIRDALLLVQEEDWQPATEPGGRPRPGAQVTELTGLVNLAAWPQGTRLIVRRERPHPGAQLAVRHHRRLPPHRVHHRHPRRRHRRPRAAAPPTRPLRTGHPRHQSLRAGPAAIRLGRRQRRLDAPHLLRH